MKQDKVRILSTVLLDPALINKAADNGIEIDVTQFIEISRLTGDKIRKEINTLYRETTTVVFTSVNAVEAVACYRKTMQPPWKIYCTGNVTKTKVSELFNPLMIAGIGDNATQLADVIIKDADNTEVVFFCGNKRRDELPDKLRKAGIAVNEIVVYKTTEKSVSIEQQYNGILFFSPSAVDSFFTVNKSWPGTTFFAIGDTTAEALRNVTDSRIVVSDRPGKEALVETAIKYYHAGSSVLA